MSSMSKKILVVDDDPVVGVLVQEFLAPSGYDITVVTSAAACIEFLDKELPEVLLLDLILPDSTGIDLLKKVRADGKSRHLTVVMLSANEDLEALVEKEGLMAQGYLGKPFTSSELNQMVSSLCNE